MSKTELRGIEKMMNIGGIAMVKKYVVFMVGVCLFCFLLIVGAEEKGLVVSYDFDAGSGSIVQDSSGNNNNGKICGAQYVQLGKGYALEFNGKDTYVDCGNRKSMTPSDDFTLEAWIKATGDDDLSSIINKGGYALPGFQMFLKNGILTACIGGDDIRHKSDSSDLRDNSWHHVSVTFTYQSGEINLYVDGELSKTSTAGAKALSPSPVLTISRGCEGGEAQYFNGLIDEVRIYNRALSAQEIKSHCDQGKEVHPAST